MHSYQRLPVELWHQILRDALRNPCLFDIEDYDQNQRIYEQKIRRQDVNARRLAQQGLEVTRHHIRSVCHSWQGFADALAEEWVEVNDMLDSASLYTPKAITASQIDYSIEQGTGTAESEDGIPKRSSEKHRARILTLNSPLSSIDTFLQRHGHLFPTLQVLDLRPAATFLCPKGGVSAGPAFFPTLSKLFPTLSSLLVDLPTSETPDVLSFPHLRRLSYNITGQSRLSDWQRGARIADWSLPLIEHVSLNPVGCNDDWKMLLLALKVWGSGLKSLCWAAAFPDAFGITIGTEDWTVCPKLKDAIYEGKVSRENTKQLVSSKDSETPEWHPFYLVPTSES